MTRIARLAGRSDLISSLPYVLGFHPRQSVVMVFLKEKRVCATLRGDLLESVHPWEPLPPEMTLPMNAVFRRERPDTVILVIFDETSHSFRGLLSQVTRACRHAGVRIGDRLLVADGRWRSLDCRDSSCCPVTGRPLAAPDAVPAVAEWVSLGVSPLSDREAVTSFFDSPAVGAFDVESPRPAPRRAIASWRREGLDAWARVLGVGPTGASRDPVDGLDEACAQAAVDVLTDIPTRDALMAWLCPDLCDPATYPRGLAELIEQCCGSVASVHDTRDPTELTWRLRDFARLLPPVAQAGVLSLVGAHSWWLGEGAFARAALERAVQLDPGYTLAALLLQLVAAGVRARPGCA
ncbi:MAG: DUF4192 domain-containing protein [Dermatophilaceae bacterium]